MNGSTQIPFYRAFNSKGDVRVEEFVSPWLGNINLEGKARFYNSKTNKYKQLDYEVTINVTDINSNWLIYDPNSDEIKTEFAGASILTSKFSISDYDPISGQNTGTFNEMRVKNVNNCTCDGHTLLHFGHKCGL